MIITKDREVENLMSKKDNGEKQRKTIAERNRYIRKERDRVKVNKER